MIVSGSSSLAVSRAALWAALSDPARLGAALPGVVTEVAVQDGRRFSALARPQTALGETPLQMEFEILEQRPQEYVRISANGSAGENHLALTVELELADDAAAGTTASWRADVVLRGVLGSLLQRGLASLLNEQVEAVLATGARISG